MLELTIKLNMINDVKEFLNEAHKIDVDIDLVHNRYVIDAKSTIGIFTLDLSEPVKVVIHSEDYNLLEPFRKWEVK